MNTVFYERVRFLSRAAPFDCSLAPRGWEGAVLLPYMGYIGMCRCEGYVFNQFTLAYGI